MIRLLKIFSVIIGIGSIFLLIKIIIIIYAIGGFDKDYSITDLKQHYILHKNDLVEISSYINRITPEGQYVDIEFENDEILKIFHLHSKNIKSYNWNLKIKSTKTDSILTELGWTENTLQILKNKLDKANCISVSNGEPTNIGFQRSSMGIYSFNLYNETIPKTDIPERYDSCTHILVDHKMILEFGGGAFGKQCFYNLE